MTDADRNAATDKGVHTMALSNWDTFAVDGMGKRSNGIFTSLLGVEIEFYKNWLYVHDPIAWRQGGRYVASTVMEVWEGELSYLDCRIFAVRGPQNGVYAIVISGYHHDNTLTCMAGIGCYGYGESEWVGVLPESKATLMGLLRDNDYVPDALKACDLFSV